MSASLVTTYDDIVAEAKRSSLACDEFVRFMTERASLEDSYAKALQKLSDHVLGSVETGSMKDALDHLKGDISNAAEQHRSMANSIRCDVVDPVVELKNSSTDVFSKVDKAKGLLKDLKTASDRCRKITKKYVSAYQNAVSAAAAADTNPPPFWEAPLDDDPWSTPEDIRKFRETEVQARTPTSAAGGASRRSVAAAAAGSGNLMSGIKVMFGSSSGQTETIKKTAVSTCATALEMQDEAEMQWGRLAGAKLELASQIEDLSSSVTGFSQRRILEFQDALRRYVIFQSSLFANCQYDTQKLSAIMEAISPDGSVVPVPELPPPPPSYPTRPRPPSAFESPLTLPASGQPSSIRPWKSSASTPVEASTPLRVMAAGTIEYCVHMLFNDRSGKRMRDVTVDEARELYESELRSPILGAETTSNAEDERDTEHCVASHASVESPPSADSSSQGHPAGEASAAPSGASSEGGRHEESGEESGGESGGEAGGEAGGEGISADRDQEVSSSGSGSGSGSGLGSRVSNKGDETSPADAQGADETKGEDGEDDAEAYSGEGAVGEEGDPEPTESDKPVGLDGEAATPEAVAGGGDSPKAESAPVAAKDATPPPPAVTAVAMQSSQGESSPRIPGLLLTETRKLLRTSHDGLSRLVRALESQRSRSLEVTPPAFDALGSLLLVALDIADQRSDFVNARSVMVISQTFYCAPSAFVGAGGSAGAGSGARASESGSGSESHTHAATTKTYLRSRVEHHRIWKNMSFWEFAVFDSLGQEMNKILSDSMFEQEEREHDVTFGQLGFFAYNMVKFGVPADSIRGLLRKYAQFVKLGQAEWETLMANVDGFLEEHGRS